MIKIPKLDSFDKTKSAFGFPVKFTLNIGELPVDGSNRESLMKDDIETSMTRGATSLYSSNLAMCR
jgi:hypothetical protein